MASRTTPLGPSGMGWTELPPALASRLMPPGAESVRAFRGPAGLVAISSVQMVNEPSPPGRWFHVSVSKPGPTTRPDDSLMAIVRRDFGMPDADEDNPRPDSMARHLWRRVHGNEVPDVG